MKIYGARLSPYFERLYLQVQAKGLKGKVEFPGVPGGDLKSAEYLAINPMGKIPAMDDDGFLLSESWAISEYIEEKFPEKPMMTGDMRQRAKIRAIGRICDFEVLPPVNALYALKAKGIEEGENLEAEFLKLNRALDCVEMFMEGGDFAFANVLSLADFSLMANVFFLGDVYKSFGRDLAAGRPKLGHWLGVHTTTDSYKEAVKIRATQLADLRKRKAAAAKK